MAAKDAGELQRELDDLQKALATAVMCPVCLNLPGSTRIPVCDNGHLVCETCFR